VPRVGITTFSTQMAISGIVNWFSHHGLQIALEIRCLHHLGRHVCGRCENPRTNLQIMFLLTSNTPREITTYRKCSASPTQWQPMLNFHHALLTEDSMFFEILPVLYVTSYWLTSSRKCWSACSTTLRRGFCTWWRRTNRSTCTMPSNYPCLLMTSSQETICQLRTFLNGMGRRWRKQAGICME
jgi:hypothetical protein